MQIVPNSGGVGAEIMGVDPARLSDAGFEVVYRAWLEHSVLLFRDVTLSDAELISFSRRFGELDLAPVQETGRRFVEGTPELYVISNVVENGSPIGSLGSGEAVWHTDMSYSHDVALANVLHCQKVPRRNGKALGETQFRLLIFRDLPARHTRDFVAGKAGPEGIFAARQPTRAKMFLRKVAHHAG